MHRKSRIRSVINKNETGNKMSNFRGSFIPPVLCLVLVMQSQDGLSRNYEQTLLGNNAGHAVEVFKNILNADSLERKLEML